MLRIFYFSGTGNARNVVQWLVSSWQERGRDAAVVNLADADPRDVRIGAEDEVGLVSPTHGFNFPRTTLTFLLGFPRTLHANRAFVVNTRAGVRFFGVHLPGLSGVTQLLAALVLLLKGYRVVGMRPIDLPSNWISLHPGLREDNVRAIYQRCATVIHRFAERLLEGRRDLHALWDLPQDLLLAPIALGYYCIGRFFFAKSFIASRACDGCGACVEQCPVEALQLIDGRPFWTWRCESCMRCMNMCPHRAIETAHGFVAAVLTLISLATTLLVVPAVNPFVPAWATAGYLGRLARLVLDGAVALAMLFLGYRLLHRGLRFRIVEKLIVATALTHFGFWRRYRAPRSGVEPTVVAPHGSG